MRAHGRARRSSRRAPPRASRCAFSCRRSRCSPSDPQARALYLYPTKALAQDQARALHAFGLTTQVRPAIYDGDTPRQERAAIRKRSNLILTNPDMLHVGILPHHPLVGGSVRATSRSSSSTRRTSTAACSARTSPTCCGGCVAPQPIYGTTPRFLLTSATIANPLELAEAR